MVDYSRYIDLNQVLSRKSCFLLGPRQTGKSWLIRTRYQAAKVYNLLEVDTYRALSRRPSLLREELQSESSDKQKSESSLVVIDEVQLLPELLNEVHLLIEERGLKFLLTGSSARKLRKQGVNLLGGRATWKTLHPLVKKEIGATFDLKRALTYGLLPSIYDSVHPHAELKDYVEVYLREEIASETAIRNLPNYSRFLDVAALCNSQVVNYTKIGSDAQLSPSTIREYFHILKDTLIISRLPAWRESKQRKASARDKFYFFDIGVARYLQGRNELVENTDDYGSALESYVYHELAAYKDYCTGESLSYWRTTSGFEVDFILGDHTAIEVKATRNASTRDLKGLRALQEEKGHKRYILVSLDPRERSSHGCEFLPIDTFIEKLWDSSL